MVERKVENAWLEGGANTVKILIFFSFPLRISDAGSWIVPGRGLDFSPSCYFILPPENHLAAVIATQTLGLLVAQENTGLFCLLIIRAKKSTCWVILWEQRRANAQSPEKAANSLALLLGRQFGATEQLCVETHCLGPRGRMFLAFRLSPQQPFGDDRRGHSFQGTNSPKQVIYLYIFEVSDKGFLLVFCSLPLTP